jgi:hypothetical protein
VVLVAVEGVLVAFPGAVASQAAYKRKTSFIAKLDGANL